MFKKFTIRQVGQWTLFAVLAFFWIRGIFFKSSFFDFEACCPFGGIQAITTYFVNGALACSMEGMQVMMGAALVLCTIVVSKLFCGYVCPVGTFSEGVGKLGKRFKIKKFEAGGIVDIVLRSVKYVLLFFTFYFTLKTNDLFCKKFDPFFATASLFGEDVSTWFAIIAITLLILGALFYKQFWCRYLCPLGAISNAFKYFYVFVALVIILVLFHQAEHTVSLTVVLILSAALAYVLEIIGLRKRAGLQVLKITRDEDKCIDCGLCDKNCPQGIKVSQQKVVNHPDCNLCTECMGICPHNEDAIGLNGSTRFKWVPILITVFFIMIGLIFGTNLRIPTVDMKWGSKEEIASSSTFEMSGIKNVKCYGSSISFVNQVKNIPGIVGAETYIRDHTVVLHYDTTKLTAPQVRKAIFEPKHFDIRIPENEAEVRLVDLYIENFFDQLDVVFVANLAREISGIYSFETVYGNPVKVRFYTDSIVSPEAIKNAIEGSDLVYKTPEESFSSKDLYTVSQISVNDTVYSGLYLKSIGFPKFQRTFNNRSSYSREQLAALVFPITKYQRNTQFMPFLANHLKNNNKHIVALFTRYTADGPVAIVNYVKSETTTEYIAELMMRKQLTITYDNGVIENTINPFEFELPKSMQNNKTAKKEQE
ncbi:4Fe-4S binding protein [uncultured Draconibacterium sp.]|uniref:4Fe-4S binding protein n=1 Tax=uncultured Draconibacterium sp. TaxID=1573823 RepID=UPI0025EF3B2B|nr:4Fe-4S binding protein [uncultured Draconibacterium sp.]